MSDMGDTCSCQVNYWDFDPPLVYNAVDRRARIQHTCCECGRTIEPGEQYEHVKALYEEPPWTEYKTCLGCSRLRAAVCSPHGGLQEMVWDLFGVSIRA